MKLTRRIYPLLFMISVWCLYSPIASAQFFDRLIDKANEVVSDALDDVNVPEVTLDNDIQQNKTEKKEENRNINNQKAAETNRITDREKTRRERRNEVLGFKEDDSNSDNSPNKIVETSSGDKQNIEIAPQQEMSNNLLNESLASIKLNMDKETVVAILTGDGWNVGAGIDRISAEKNDADNNYDISIKLDTIQSEERLVSEISYTRAYKTAKVDIDVMHDALVEKYGAPYYDFNNSGMSSIRFSDAGSDVKFERDIVYLCRDDMLESGKQSIPSLALGAAQGVISLNSWRTHGNQKVKETCSGAVAAFDKYIKDMLAPNLSADIGKSRMSSFYSVTRVLKWQYPHEIYNQQQAFARRKAEENRPTATLD